MVKLFSFPQDFSTMTKGGQQFYSLKALHSNLSLLTIVNDTFICTSNNRFHGEIDEGAVQWKSPHQSPCPPDQLQTPTEDVDTSSHTCTKNVKHVQSFAGKIGKSFEAFIITTL